MSEKIQRLPKPAAIGFVVFCVALGMWMFGYKAHFWSRPLTQEDISGHNPEQPGGMPHAPRSIEEVRDYQKAEGLPHVYTLGSMVAGGLLGGILGLLGIPLINWCSRRKPKSEQKTDSGQPADGEVSSESPLSDELSS